MTTDNLQVGKDVLTVESDGLYRTMKERVKAGGILQRKARLERTLLELDHEIRQLQEKAAKLKPELDFYNSQPVQNVLNQEKLRREESEVRAQELLRQYIGSKNFDILKHKKYLFFTANDGRKYKLSIHGDVYRDISGEWKRLCIIRPKNLPLPDVVVTVLANVKENPSKYPLRRR
jgi:predicted nuclease with TOPRIM domain